MLVQYYWGSARVSMKVTYVKTTGRVVEVPVGDAMLGRVVNAPGTAN